MSSQNVIKDNKFYKYQPVNMYSIREAQVYSTLVPYLPYIPQIEITQQQCTIILPQYRPLIITDIEKFFKDMIYYLAVLEKCQIKHGDIKHENIVTDGQNYHLIDYGMARWFSEGNIDTHVYGNLLHYPPEILFQRALSSESFSKFDIWGIAVCILEHFKCFPYDDSQAVAKEKIKYFLFEYCNNYYASYEIFASIMECEKNYNAMDYLDIKKLGIALPPLIEKYFPLILRYNPHERISALRIYHDIFPQQLPILIQPTYNVVDVRCKQLLFLFMRYPARICNIVMENIYRVFSVTAVLNIIDFLDIVRTIFYNVYVFFSTKPVAEFNPIVLTQLNYQIYTHVPLNYYVVPSNSICTKWKKINTYKLKVESSVVSPMVSSKYTLIIHQLKTYNYIKVHTLFLFYNILALLKNEDISYEVAMAVSNYVFYMTPIERKYEAYVVVDYFSYITACDFVENKDEFTERCILEIYLHSANCSIATGYQIYITAMYIADKCNNIKSKYQYHPTMLNYIVQCVSKNTCMALNNVDVQRIYRAFVKYN